MKTWRNDKIGLSDMLERCGRFHERFIKLLLFGEFARIVIRGAATGNGECDLIRDAKSRAPTLA